MAILGIWKISDFGISAYDTLTERKHRDLDTVGDAARESKFSGATSVSHRGHPGVRTEIITALRKPGTYTAPEVDFGKSIGRRSDIWSFMCIFTEILTFLLGDTGHDSVAVRKFSQDRFKDEKNFAFYSTTTASSAVTPEYYVRPAVYTRLDECMLVKPACDWVQYCVELIKKSLVVYGRPDSVFLKERTAHVARHVHGQCKNSLECPFPPYEPVSKTIPRKPLATSAPTVKGPQRLALPNLTITTEEAFTLSNQTTHTTGSSATSLSTNRADPGLISTSTPTSREGRASDVVLLSQERVGRSKSHPKHDTDTVTIIPQKSQFSRKRYPVSICNKFVAWLHPNKIYVYRIQVEKVSPQFPLHCAIAVSGDTFDGICVDGDHVLVYCVPRQNIRLFRLARGTNPSFRPEAASENREKPFEELSLPEFEEIVGLRHVTISARGLVVLVCRSNVYIVNAW